MADESRSQDARSPSTQYADALVPRLKDLGLKILLEPGRYHRRQRRRPPHPRASTKRQGAAKTFKIVDAGMNDLIRPALYEGHHEIVPLVSPLNRIHRTTPSGTGARRSMSSGPICESGDFFCQDRELADLQPGDLIALMSAGAYGFAMASNYNSRPLPAEILVDGDQAHLVRARQSYEDLTPGRKNPHLTAIP